MLLIGRLLSKTSPSLLTLNRPFLTPASFLSYGAMADVKLRLVQFETASSPQRVGVQLGDGGSVVDVCAAEPSLPRDMRSFLQGCDTNLPLAAKVAVSSSSEHIFAAASCTLKAPIYDPQKLLCVGMNYVDHCKEQNYPVPQEPVIFSKFASAITEPNGAVIHPKETDSLDYEVELAFVISRRGKHIKESEAMSHVAGYTVAHDVSARDWQMKKNGKQWLLGKTFDTFCPLGPAIVTPSSLSDPHKLGIRCRLNGELVQNSNTEQLVHKTEALVAFISRFVTLEPGDVVLTGTPPGVGCFRDPPIWLKKGDVVECEIDEIGKITNTIIQ
jgi:2-keto-4-pentenoate hydratase/2-oxohepta-3-ene-1,7-dioic acid hydratase in catechol pathway